ncbi:hypothetical protein HYY75_05430 [bacterium]|nr:hypothetical protein [bacterium]
MANFFPLNFDRKNIKTKPGLSFRVFLLFIVIYLVSLAGLNPIFSQEMSDGEFIPHKASKTIYLTESEQGRTASESFQETRGNSPAEPGELSYSAIVILMIIGGMVLLFIEVTLIPGFGLTGITGIIVILSALALSFWKLDIKLAIIYTIVSVVIFILLGLWVAYVFPYTTMGRKFVLQTTISVEGGYIATEDLSGFVGLEGVATSDLRPCGIARIGETRVDVMSEGDFIPHGTKIKVVKSKNNSLIVIPIVQSSQEDAGKH